MQCKLISVSLRWSVQSGMANLANLVQLMSKEAFEVLKDAGSILWTLWEFVALMVALQCCRQQGWLHGGWELCDKAERLGQCPVAVLLLCLEALTGRAGLGIAVLLFLARVTTLQRCTASAGHISVAFCVTVLRSCRAWLRDLGCLTWLKPKLIQACSFWSWCTMEQVIHTYKTRCWWPLNPIGKHSLSS